MWSLGCMLAGMIFKKEPFFQGSNNQDQLYKIISVLGSARFDEYLQKYNIRPCSKLHFTKMYIAPKPWTSFINNNNAQFATPDAIDFIDKCTCPLLPPFSNIIVLSLLMSILFAVLRFDHQERLSASEALKHPWFDPIRSMRPNSKTSEQTSGASDAGKANCSMYVASDSSDVQPGFNNNGNGKDYYANFPNN